MTDFAKETLQYHGMLNPVAWQGMELKPDVRNALLRVGQAFVDTWGFDIPVKDIILTGSNANYNFTMFSDWDVHVVADMKAVPAASKEFVESYLKARKNLWNQSKKITVKGYPVEVYAQDDDEILISDGVYSLMSNQWLKEPKKVEPHIDHLAVREKVEDLTHQIEEAIEGGLQEAPMAILKKLANMRKSALQTAGEFSVENMAFKVLRNNGMIEKLRNALEEYTTKNLTLEGVDQPLKIKRNKWKKRVVDDQTEGLENESAEEILELSRDLMKRYEKAAITDIEKHWDAADKEPDQRGTGVAGSKRTAKFWNHIDRIGKRTQGLRNVFHKKVVKESHDFKVGDVVKPKVGVHAGHPHKVIHVDGDRINVAPIGLRNVKYHLGAAQAHPSELVREDVELTELSKEKLKAYRSEAQLGSVPSEKELKQYGYTEDDYGEKAKKRSRGVKTATAKIIKKHEDEAAIARANRQARSPEKEAEAKARRAKWVAANPDKAKQHGVKIDEALSGAQGRDPLMRKQLSPHMSNAHRMAAQTRREMNKKLLAKLAQRKADHEAKYKEQPREVDYNYPYRADESVELDANSKITDLQEKGLTVYGRWKKARVAKIWGWKRNKFKKKALAQSASNKTIDRRSGLSARHSLYKKVLRGGNKKKLAYSARKSVEGVVKRQHTAFITIPGTRSRWKTRGRDDRRVSGSGQTKI